MTLAEPGELLASTQGDPANKWSSNLPRRKNIGFMVMRLETRAAPARETKAELPVLMLFWAVTGEAT